MKKLHAKKVNVNLYCEQQMRQEEIEGEQKSIDLIKKFESLRKHKLRDIEESAENKLLLLDEY